MAKVKKNIGYEYIKELDSYFKDIQNIRKLTTKEEKELSDKIKQGNKQALDKLVYHNLRFVVNVAKNYRNRGVPFGDIIAEGNLGLIHAAEKFDADKGVKFISYAVWWIKNSINNCIDMYKRNNESIDYDEYVMDNYDGSSVDKGDFINEEFEKELIDLQSRQSCVNDIMKCLKEREYKIIMLYYGLEDGKEHTLEEVGSYMNLTNERVRQIKDDAISKLKCQMLFYDNEEIMTYKCLS